MVPPLELIWDNCEAEVAIHYILGYSDDNSVAVTILRHGLLRFRHALRMSFHWFLRHALFMGAKTKWKKLYITDTRRSVMIVWLKF